MAYQVISKSRYPSNLHGKEVIPIYDYFHIPPNIPSIKSSLSPNNIDSVLSRGRSLWKSIYNPFDAKLADKLAQSHPDLPVFIIEGEYGCLFTDPNVPKPAKVGRVLTSIIAIGCLRAQTGVGPQVLSHVFGLRKAFEDGTAEAEGEAEVEGGKWLASDEGNMWLLDVTDRIVEAIGAGQGTTFAPGFIKAKL